MFDSSREMPICPVLKTKLMLGKVLTILDAANANDATKQLVKQTVWEWYNELPGYTSLSDDQNEKVGTLSASALGDCGEIN